MTLGNLRDEITKKGEIPLYGMKFRLFDNDLVKIYISNNVFQMKYSTFVDTSDNLGFSKKIYDTDITDLRIIRDENIPHTMILVIDTRKKKVKEKVDTGIKAGMKFI